MRNALKPWPLAVVCLLASAPIAVAADFEITGFGGYTFPFYSQTFTYGPGPISINIPDISITQSGSFKIKASGGASFGGALAFYPVHAIGIEVRLDSADLKLEPEASTFDVDVTLPAPLEPIHSTLTLDQGTAALKTANTYSINLRVRTGGQTHLFASGGLSHLGNLQASIRQPVALGVTSADFVTNKLNVATIDLQAQVPLDKQGSSWGGNLGLGFQIGLGQHGGILVEGRGFVFPKRTAEWQGVIESPLTPLEQELLNRTLSSLPSVEIQPWWVQATIGISYRF
ncbi:MAG TPA: hypothetical protein VMX54_08695 [Vicinamibacteria bacterium]|nr:hypothetical protein [Vicinamibacteria bacterium]